MHSRLHSFWLPSFSIIIIYLSCILSAAFWGRQKICSASAEDWNDEKYIQSLPDRSFVVVEVKPDGTVIRLLPHHDAEGNLVYSMLIKSIDKIFELDPNDRKEAREHLLQDYYELLGPRAESIDRKRLEY